MNTFLGILGTLAKGKATLAGLTIGGFTVAGSVVLPDLPDVVVQGAGVVSGVLTLFGIGRKAGYEGARVRSGGRGR